MKNKDRKETTRKETLWMLRDILLPSIQTLFNCCHRLISCGAACIKKSYRHASANRGISIKVCGWDRQCSLWLPEERALPPLMCCLWLKAGSFPKSFGFWSVGETERKAALIPAVHSLTREFRSCRDNISPSQMLLAHTRYICRWKLLGTIASILFKLFRKDQANKSLRKTYSGLCAVCRWKKNITGCDRLPA